MGKKKMAMLVVATLLYGTSFALPQTQMVEAAENPMQIIGEQLAYNPHLNDPIVKTKDAVATVKAGKLQGSKHEGIYQYL